MSNFIKSYQANVGLNHVPAYQVSGQPFATGSLTAPASGSTPIKVEFLCYPLDKNCTSNRQFCKPFASWIF